MKDADKERLVAAYIRAQEAPGEGWKGADGWAIEAMMNMCRDHPELAWELVVRIHEVATSDDARMMLACGPIEDLLHDHSAQFVDRVVELAERDVRFADLMKRCWFTREELDDDTRTKLGRYVRLSPPADG